MLPTAIVAYLALFATVGFLFVLASLILGWFLRARAPSSEKAATYECGEPSVGPNNVQFDLRFYVVALVFLIFEVEVAFFFPPAVVFGKANLLRNPDRRNVGVVFSNGPAGSPANGAFLKLGSEAEKVYGEFGVDASTVLEGDKKGYAGIPAYKSAENSNKEMIEKQMDTLSLASMLDLSVFFAVLLVGFAFVWSRGDLNWVRSTRHPTTTLETAVMMSKMRKGDL